MLYFLKTWSFEQGFFTSVRDIMNFFLCVLGMVMVVEGLPYFAFPEKMKFWVQKVLEMPDSTLRKFGFVLMLTGLGLVYMGKS